jgi:protein subunit release factor B
MHQIQQTTVDKRERITILSVKDLDFSYFCGSGHGGQAKNKVHSGCQIIHRESGAIGRASDSRSLEQNKRSAFERLLKTPQMKFWLARRVHEIKMGESIEEEISHETTSDKLKFEIKNTDGQWQEVPDSYFESDMAKKEYVKSSQTKNN